MLIKFLLAPITSTVVSRAWGVSKLRAMHEKNRFRQRNHCADNSQPHISIKYAAKHDLRKHAPQQDFAKCDRLTHSQPRGKGGSPEFRGEKEFEVFSLNREESFGFKLQPRPHKH